MWLPLITLITLRLDTGEGRHKAYPYILRASHVSWPVACAIAAAVGVALAEESLVEVRTCPD